LRFERTQKFTDPPVTRCPECRKNRVRKLLTPPGIVFKGSGWYATDHRSPSGAGSASKKSEGKSESSSPSEKSGGDKSTTKSETKSSSSDE
jgi:putative FmdB family regulatory protein